MLFNFGGMRKGLPELRRLEERAIQLLKFFPCIFCNVPFH
jgi:hypothetical protein